ncbi:MAG: RNA polymerase sigma factor, partial [Bacteroidia bacterium]
SSLVPFSKSTSTQLPSEKKDSLEEALITGLRESNAQSINQLYKLYAPALFGIIKRIVRYDEVAEDVLQEVFVKIWKSIPLYDPSKGRLFTWMANLAKNLSIDQIRSKSANNTSKTDDIQKISCDVINPKFNFHLNTDAIGLRGLLYTLKSDQKLIVDLIYFQGYTHIQAAEILNIPLGTIKTKLRQSILTLRKNFGEFKIPA